MLCHVRALLTLSRKIDQNITLKILKILFVTQQEITIEKEKFTYDHFWILISVQQEFPF